MAPPAKSDIETPAARASTRLVWWKKVLFSLVALLIFFGLPELILTVLDYPPPKPIYNTRPDIFWGLESNLNQKDFFHKELGTSFKVSTNGRSMRYDEIPIGRQPGVIRLLALGDSTTFGWGVEQDKTYPAQLEKMLGTLQLERYPDVKIQVINGGVPGYTSFQGLHHFKTNAAAYEADIILFGYIVQDARRTRITDKQQAIDAMSVDYLRDHPLDALRTFRVLSDRYKWLRSKVADEENKQAAGDPNSVTRVPLDDYRENILTFERQVKKHDGRLILFGFPLEVVGYTRAHRKLLKSVAEEEKLDHFDPSPVITGLARKQTLYFPKDKGHANAAGCKLIAEQVAQYLDQSGILKETIAERRE